ncbi:putative cytochrome P450 monooxygenase [Talaromyces proteolyticus]|uniref:Cytochrome P450 monooxygenase n=1 Tax=Talaromyces proteolyticus TaxID=1131652 RepID=A0AAD4KFY6_9EURO|nr:putative cytochrome P450 monooxygenase [Talaromyces proteolyticus]KAH8689456.1 putative cytochrome P450 monooxygenase [Talaromyces proteolyticus]
MTPHDPLTFQLHLFLAVQATVAVLLAWLIGKIIYNLYFHPLRNYPGPFLARATSLYSTFFDYRGDLHTKSKELHDAYGEVVRTAPNSLSYNSAQAWEEICGHRKASHQELFDKDQEFFGEQPNSKPNIVAAVGEEHRRLRRLLAHAFSDKALREQESCIQGYVDLFISQLRKRATEGDGVVDMVNWFNFMTFDVIGDLAFGESFALLEDGICKRYLTSLLGLLEWGAFNRNVKRILPESCKGLATYMVPKNHSEDRMYQYYLSKDKLSRRIALDTDRRDFVHHMLKGSQEAIGPGGLTFEEMTSQGTLLLVAGSETTATLLSGMLYYLLKHPSAMTRLTTEIRSSFTSSTEIHVQNVTPLPYLHAVIEESLRMYPPVPNVLPRKAPAPGVVVCGQFVPPGTSLGMHHWSCYHSSKNFFAPDEFHPERWIPGKDERFANDNKNAFHPFSYGPRNCLGKNLAYAELRLTVSKFFWNFDVELQQKPGSKEWLQQRSNTLWMKNALNVKLFPRDVV